MAQPGETLVNPATGQRLVRLGKECRVLETGDALAIPPGRGVG